MSLTSADIAPRLDVRGTIVGVGVDLVDVPTFAAQLEQPGTRFEQMFTIAERRDAREGSGGYAMHLAARWAAKEAFIKAWSASMFGSPPPLPEAIHRDIEVVLDAWRRPRLVFHGAVAPHVERFTTHISLSHDGDSAFAYVVLAAT